MLGSIIAGAVLIATGTLVTLAGVSLTVAEIISGRHRSGAPMGQTYAGLDWTGIGAVLTAFARILEALKDWPAPALLIFLGLTFDVLGTVVLAGQWF